MIAKHKMFQRGGKNKQTKIQTKNNCWQHKGLRKLAHFLRKTSEGTRNQPIRAKKPLSFPQNHLCNGCCKIRVSFKPHLSSLCLRDLGLSWVAQGIIIEASGSTYVNVKILKTPWLCCQGKLSLSWKLPKTFR